MQLKRFSPLLLAGILAAAALPAASRQKDFDLGGLFKGGAALGLAERILEQELTRRLAPAERYQVRIDREGSDLFGGRLGRVAVTGTELRTPDGLQIPRMDLRLRDVHLGLLDRKLEGIGSGDFSLALGQEAVNHFLGARARRVGGVDVKDVSVALRGSQLMVRATPALMGLDLPSEVTGKPVLSGGDAVDFRADRAAVLGFRLPSFALRELEKRVNPVADFSGLKLPVQITRLRLQGGRLLVDGDLRVEDLGRAVRRRERR